MSAAAILDDYLGELLDAAQGACAPVAASAPMAPATPDRALDTTPSLASERHSAPAAGPAPAPAAAQPGTIGAGTAAPRPTSAPPSRAMPPATPRPPVPAWQQALDPHPHEIAQSPHLATDHSSRWLRLRCGEQAYALELLKVQEVVLPAPLLPLRGAAPSMLGVMNLRGQVVPVIDLGLHLGAAAIETGLQTRIVVLEEDGESLGLRVSAVEDVASLAEQQIEPPDNARICRISNHLFRGVARTGRQPVILLDASRLLH